MKAFILTVFVILIFMYLLYRTYIGYKILSKKRKYNRSNNSLEWQINQDPLARFFRYGTFKKIEIKGYDYKILKEKDEEETKS